MKTKTITQEIKDFVDQGLNVDEIAQKVNRSQHYVKNIIYRIKTRNLTTDDKILILELTENDNQEIELYIKTSKAYEDYLRDTKEILDTDNLLNQSSGQAYKMRLDISNNYLDDINQSIIYNNQINMAIFRIVGISDGIKLKINNRRNNIMNNIISKQQLKLYLNDINKKFNDFYVKFILNHKINLSSELVLK